MNTSASYVDHYSSTLEEAARLAEYSSSALAHPVLGFTSDCDIVLRWDAAQYNRLLAEYLHEIPSARPGEVIGSMEDFARISSAYMLRGDGGCIEIATPDICDRIRSGFSGEYALGGTAAQGAAALGTLGFAADVHVTDDSRQVCQLLDHEKITTICGGDRIPMGSAFSDREPIYHIILQYHRGDKLTIGGQEYVIPHSNRLILICDELQKVVPVRQDFLDYWLCPDHVPSSFLISGMDSIVDPDIIRKRCGELVPFLHRFRQVHPGVPVYLEGAFYLNPEVMDILYSSLIPLTDIFGINEEELKDLSVKLGVTVCPDDAGSIIAGLDTIREHYRGRGMILHTKDYSLYYGEALADTDIAFGLTMGNLMSGTRARIGHYGTLAECRDTLAVPLSSDGLAMFAKMAEIRTDRQLMVVPTRLTDKPKYTIGLGDTFVAGVHTAFLSRQGG